ncbi:MAG: acetolactate synthase large subunit, partial [Candidatus Obscuribacterales bacterium]|nr:acetolactate synthase large subunit [Candidatus Obscuribacterales bacterium]
VLIDLPKDIALNSIETPEDFEFRGGEVEPLARPEARQLAMAREMIGNCKKPLVYAGGGIRIAEARSELAAFVAATGIPVVSTLHGLGAIDASDQLNLGMLGMHGTKAANLSVQECDLLIAVGARFDDRVTGKLSEFAPHARIVHLDGDPSELSKLRHADCPVPGDIKVSLNFLHQKLDISEWQASVRQRKEKFSFSYDSPGDCVYAPYFLKVLSDRKDEKTIITADVGQHQMWVAQHVAINDPRKHISSGGLGTMGFGLPAAIGAQFARPDACVIAISGDGSIMMNIQELATLNRYRLPVKIVLFDNKSLGMVRQWQQLFFSQRYSEVDLSDNPDFVAVARAFGIEGIRVEKKAQIDSAIEKIFNEKGPLLVHVLIDPRANVWPLVPPGMPNSKMLEETSA